MRVTYPEAEFNFMDVSALEDSVAQSSGNKEFADLALLKTDVEMRRYGTLEKNQFILDGNMEIFPGNGPDDVPFWSTDRSGENRSYNAEPEISVTFSKPHSSIGITLFFAGNVPGKISITWYTISGMLLDQDEYFPDSTVYFCEKNVQEYGRITIRFLESTWPDRYVKLTHIQYGGEWILGRDRIKTASIFEELDMTSATLPINTAKLEIIDKNNDFDLSDQKGLWKNLQAQQDITMTEYVNGEAVECGTFYLDTWDAKDKVVSLSLVDRIGIMDKTTYYGGTIYQDSYAGVIIADIMADCGVKKYSIAEEVYYTKLNGWLAIQSHRAALQQVMFACGAVADCSRSDWVRIYKPDKYVSHTIGLGRKLLGSKITLDTYISGVSISCVQYILEDDISDICKDIFSQGRTLVEFTEPYLAGSIAVSAGKIISAKTNMVEIEMAETGECVISGRRYRKKESVHTVKSAVEPGEKECIKAYSGCTMMDTTRAKEVAPSILDYVSMRQVIELRYINNGEAVGNWCNMAIDREAEATTAIISQTLDLTGGNIASARCRGFELVTASMYFTGSELYAGEEGLI